MQIRFVGTFLSVLTCFGCGAFDSSKGQQNVAAEASNSLARKPYGTCDRKAVTTVNLCMEAVGKVYSDTSYLDILKNSCESSGGVYSTDNCDTTESLGLCIIGMGESNLTYVTYYPPQFTVEAAKISCVDDEGGVFIGGE